MPRRSAHRGNRRPVRVDLAMVVLGIVGAYAAGLLTGPLLQVVLR